MSRNNVFRLAGAQRDKENRELLDRLAEQEGSGEIVGLIAVTFCRRGRKKQYYVSTTGWPDDNPTLAVSAMASC